MPTIEISGPDDQGKYTVEVESDADESSEESGSGGGPASSADAQGAPGATDDDGSGQEDESESGEGQSITCGSIKEVLQAVKSIMQGESTGGNPQAMWDQEAAKTASSKQQSNLY